MSNKNILLVPIQLDALFVASETMVTEAFADFSRLPYSKDRTDYNPDTANLSESILSTPFQNENLNLGKGMHLHWALPAALTKGGANGSPESFEAVPNRWLITRRKHGHISKQWIVESDYLQSEPEGGGIAFPDLTPGSTSPQPFNYLGRQLEYTGWKEDPGAKRLPRLTAMGYGEPAFAAFYPNCHSVFGCYDADITKESMEGLSYQLLGWYSNAKQDPFHTLIMSKAFKDIQEKGGAKEGPVQDFFKLKLGWQVPVTGSNSSQLPAAMYCYSHLDVAPAKTLHNERRHEKVKLGIGNTGTEAMSAFLARMLAPQSSDTANLIEEQLESLVAHRNINDKELDLWARLKAARHERSFKAEKGGHIWVISAENDKQEVTIHLPASIGQLLNSLNEQQKESDEEQARLRYRKHLLFADWYKYMLCAYPPDYGESDYPDIDVVKDYIERTLLVEPLKELKRAVLPELNARIGQFNDSDIPSLLSIKLNKKDDTAFPGIEGKWIENQPFSGHCLQFNNDNNDRHQVVVSLDKYKPVKAVSLWVNLAARQANEAVLLATKKKGVQIGKTTIVNDLCKVAINGTILPASRPLQWHGFPKNQWFHLHIEWDKPLDKDDIIYLFASNNSAFLNGKLVSVRFFEKAVSADELPCDMNILGHQHYILKPVAGPRYWQPTEPVILLEGEVVKPTNRHNWVGNAGAGNFLPCQIATVGNYPLQPADVTTLLAEIHKNKPATGQQRPGFNTWNTQPWNPFLLEWQVEVNPMQLAGNLATDDGNFAPDYITTNCYLAARSVEFEKVGGFNTSAAAWYTGRSILVPHSKLQFLKVIEDHIKHLTQEDCYHVVGSFPTQAGKDNYNKKLSEWYKNKPLLPDNVSIDDEKEIIHKYLEWYKIKPVYNGSVQEFSKAFTDENPLLKDFNYTLIQAAVKLIDGHFLSQALSGFNNALLMLRQTLQLPVGDPLAFPEYKRFTDRVKGAVAGNNNLAPMPHNDFLPIRTGNMKLHRLRIIDSFGQGRDLDISEFVAATSLNQVKRQDHVWLPPRFVPPARINFRWLSALNDGHEMSTLSQDNPICGWLLANHLDNSIMVYDREGHMLGFIDQQATWRTAPGCPVNYQVHDITNPHLRKIVQELSNKVEFLQHFITITDNALENIHPEADAHHQEMALLMGKPMAVVRATIGLQLKEGPPIHHGWVEFLKDLDRGARSTGNFEKVKVPVRLGDSSQLNDGLVGYWGEDAQQALEPIFYSTSINAGIRHTQIKYLHRQNNPDLQLTLEKASAKTLTMLVYPPGEVHAITGILPVKAIHIPKDQYTPALKNMHITFLSAPVLTGNDQLALPLPKEMGYEWSWLAKDRFTWLEVAEHGVVRKDSALKTFDNGAELWQHLLQKGWLVEIDDNRAGIVPPDQRSAAELDAPFNKQADAIQHWLDAGHIIPVETKAAFAGRQFIKEGWLKLKPS